MDEDDIFANNELYGEIVRYFLKNNNIDYLINKKFKLNRSAWTVVKNHEINTNWGKLINHPDINDHNSPQGKLFRRRFRVPFPLFEWIVLKCKLENVFKCNNGNNNKIPVEIKVLCCLRILGRDNCADDIAEMADIGASTVNTIFHLFLDNFSKFLDEFVHPPAVNSAFLGDVMNVYEKLGFPGCIGSMDATHIKWSKCTKKLQNQCRGKEKFPTLSFNCVVDHSRRIHHCSTAFVGTTNDQTLSRHDQYCIDLEKNNTYEDITYTLYDKAGVPHLVKGCYVLCDGGYRNEKFYMDPIKNKFDYHTILYNEILESIRKDVECTFGIIKQRFRILRNGISYMHGETIQKIMYSVCILHNMILMYDEKDLSHWEKNVNWVNLDPDIEDVIVDNNDDFDLISNSNTFILNGDTGGEMLFNQSNLNVIALIESTYSNKYEKLQTALCNNYAFKHSLGLTYWPKNILNVTKSNFKIPNILDRVRKEVSRTLYAASTSIYNINYINNNRNEGLFSHLHYKENEVITCYRGEFITSQIANQRMLDGKGNHIIKVTNSKYLDCYATRKAYICLASLANSPFNCNYLVSHSPAKANAEIVIDNVNHIVYLKVIAGTNILPHTEILVTYE